MVEKMKKNLLIIAAGPDALFQEWGEYKDYDFDVAIIRWGDFDLKNVEDAAYYESITGYKFHIIDKFRKKHDISQYEYIWCLDDDCISTWDLVEETFKFMKDENLDMAQPALEPSGCWAWEQTKCVLGSKMRISDCVEIMAPIFSQRAWQVCCDDILEKLPFGAGYYLEGYWKAKLESHTGTTKFGGRVAIIDRLPVYHTKPATSPAEWAARGLDAGADGRYLVAELGYQLEWNILETIPDHD
jgi:hypothetical protein